MYELGRIKYLLFEDYLYRNPIICTTKQLELIWQLSRVPEYKSKVPKSIEYLYVSCLYDGLYNDLMFSHAMRKCATGIALLNIDILKLN